MRVPLFFMWAVAQGSLQLGLQVWLAVPSNCPQGPNGEKKKLSAAQAISSTVGMYVSDAQGTNFKEVCCMFSSTITHGIPHPTLRESFWSQLAIWLL